MSSNSKFQDWDLIRLEPMQVCVYWHSICVFTCGSVLLCLEGTTFLKSPIISGSFNLSSSSSTFPVFRLAGKCLMMTSHSGPSSHSLQSRVIGLCVSSYLLQEACSLMRVEWTLVYDQQSFKVLCIFYPPYNWL